MFLRYRNRHITQKISSIKTGLGTSAEGLMMHPSTFCRDFGREIGLFCISPCSAADVVLVHMTIAPAGFVLLALLQITHNI